jgi:hypothetical protein
MSIHYAYILLTLFGWPAGIVLGNLLANLFWLPIQYLGLHLKLATHHDALHARLDSIERLLEPCPSCADRRSEPGLLPGMTAPSIADDSNHAEA